MNEDYIAYTPGDFVAVFNQSIEYAFSTVVIEGEISSFRIAKGKWVYFDIKDQEATLRCFGTVYMLPGPLEDGMMVRIVCSPRLHPQFNFSLNVQSIVPIGQGALAKQAELLFRKLEAEGIFSQDRKRQIPYPPERIALVTSAESAAYADFTKIVTARWPFMKVDVYDVQVQGAAAPEQIKTAIETANASGEEYEALVLIRGGGSAEDLSAFNDERVIRAVVGSRLPTMVAIGHEVDESLTELASDKRASTPSNAAELITPEIDTEKNSLETQKFSLYGSLKSAVYAGKEKIQNDRAEMLLNIQSAVILSRQQVAHMYATLRLLNPSEVLKRGYSIILKDQKSVKLGSTLQSGDKIGIVFTDQKREAIIQ